MVIYFIVHCWCNDENRVCVSYTEDLQRGHQDMLETAEYNVITKTIVLNEGSADEARENIKQYFMDTFDLDTSLFNHIKSEYLWNRADPLRHPVCWYAAHTATFYINKLRVAGAIKSPHNKHFESTFAVGVDEMSWDDKLEDRDDWPNPEEIFKYRQQVRDIVINVIDTVELKLPIKWDSIFYAVLMGIEHERIHIETSSVLIRQLPVDVFYDESDISPKTPWDNICKVGEFQVGNAPKNELIPVKGKIVNYGREKNDFSQNSSLPVYGWDNEFGEMSVDVPDFKASKYLVSNEEYYEFVLDDGYKTKKYWTDEGWRWVQSTKSTKPKFWIEKNGKYYLRNMLNEIELPWNWPVITNHLEGLAFTSWKSDKLNKTIRLLTEDEWHVLRQLGEYGNIDQPNWEIAPGNINLEYYASECPIDMFQFGTTGFYDIVGNVWQHTLTPQHPFDGFEVHAIYDDFTVPCFGPHHNIIKGGSWISTGNEAIALSRYQFRRHFFQHAGIRYIESDRDLSYLSQLADRNPYDDDDMVNLFTHFAWTKDEYFNIPNYPKRIAEIALNFTKNKPNLSALDVGCATGRTAFELANKYQYVVGIDWTVRLIGVGYRMQENEFLEWTLPEQGDINAHYKVTAKELGIDKTLQRVFFLQNDAQNMDKDVTNFDLIIASNLIDRLSNPLLFLKSIHDRIKIGGIFLLCDPFTWNVQFTAKQNWIGAVVNQTDHQPIYSEDALRKLLTTKNHDNDYHINWKIIQEMDVPLVIKESERKYQHINTHCMVLERV